MSKEVETVMIEDRENQEQDRNQLDQSFDERYSHENADNNHEFDDEELEDILDDECNSKESMMLKFKVEQLQKICNSLSESNRKLIAKITKMQEQLQQKNNISASQSSVFEDQYSQLNVQFTEVEELINEYRESLNQFQKGVLNDMKSKDRAIEKLQEEARNFNKISRDLQFDKEETQKINKQLQTRNEGLILQVENLQKNIAWLQDKLNTKSYQLPYLQNMSTRYDSSYIEDDLSSEMQAELEAIIDKLVKELEYEKTIKKKLNDELKRMSSQLMDSEKQIMDKNRKLYELQMKLLKNNKKTINVDISQKYRHHPDDEKTQRIQNKSAECRVTFKSFSLLEMINQEIEQTLSFKERKTIATKILELYERKIEKNDFLALLPETIMINNFNHKRPQLISIRKTDNPHIQDDQQTEGSLIWNLAFIFENIFRDNIDSDPHLAKIIEQTAKMLDNQYENTIGDIKQLKALL